MKLTKEQLKRIIKEELSKTLKEYGPFGSVMEDPLAGLLQKIKTEPDRSHHLPLNMKIDEEQLKSAVFTLVGEGNQGCYIMEGRDHQKEDDYWSGSVFIRIGNVDYDGDYVERFDFHNLHEETDWERTSVRTFRTTDNTKVRFDDL